MTSWWHRLLFRKKMEDKLERELSFHLDQHASDLMARGYDRQEARRQARIALGGPDQVKEQCRDARGTRWLEDFWQDLRYALRTLRKNPGFAAVALLTLALGSGATTVMFTVINGVLLKPLPYPDPDRLVRIQEQTDYSTQYGNTWGVTYPNYLDARGDNRSLIMGVWRWSTATLSKPGDPENVTTLEFSPEMFDVLGIKPALGRVFQASDDPGSTPVAMITYALWQRKFGGSAAILGTPLTYDGTTFTIVGILRDGVELPDPDTAVLTAIAQDTQPFMRSRGYHGFRVWARLKPSATLAQAQAQLTVTGRQLAAQYPDTNKGRTFVASQLRPDVSDVRSTLWLLLGAVSVVLLIACVNIASLLLARAVSRERELSMRVALGAGRGRLARQCLTESGVLALGGGLLGIALAAAGIRPFIVFWPGGLPRASEVSLDWRVLLFTLAISLACGLLFGLAPALRAQSRHLEQSVRAGARTIGIGSRRLHYSFVVSEMALAVVLLVCAGMLGRTLLHLSALDSGVNLSNVLTARTSLSPATLASPDKTRAAWRDVMDRVRAIPGVESVAMVDTVPMREGNNQVGYSTTADRPPADKQPLVLTTSVSPDYLKVMGLKLLRGRFITDHDRQGSADVAVIDTVLAQEAFHGQDPIGKPLWLGTSSAPVRIVGLVGHVRHWGPAGDDTAHVRAQVYYAFEQVNDRFVRRWSELSSLAVRTSIDPLSIVPALRRAVRGATDDQVIYEVRTMAELGRASLARQRFLVLLFGMFAGLALVLACIGIYGVLAYLTSQRIPEMGVRMALGARSSNVLWHVLRGSLGMILGGVALGMLGALAAARILETQIEGMQHNGPSTFGIMIPVLLTAALIASFIPARRASRIDPVRALRQE